MGACAGAAQRGVKTVVVVLRALVIVHHASSASRSSSASSGARARGAAAGAGAGAGAGGARWPAAAPHARSQDGQARHTSHAVLAGAW